MHEIFTLFCDVGKKRGMFYCIHKFGGKLKFVLNTKEKYCRDFILWSLFNDLVMTLLLAGMVRQGLTNQRTVQLMPAGKRTVNDHENLFLKGLKISYKNNKLTLSLN